MEETDLYTLDDAALIWKCVEPVIKRMRAKAFDIKSEVYGGLSRGQRALIMFQVLRGHMGCGVADLLSNLSYLLCREEVWREMKNAFLYFGNSAMAALTEDMHTLYSEMKNSGSRTKERIEAMRSIDSRLETLMPEAERLIGEFIRKHPEEFIK